MTVEEFITRKVEEIKEECPQVEIILPDRSHMAGVDVWNGGWALRNFDEKGKHYGVQIVLDLDNVLIFPINENLEEELSDEALEEIVNENVYKMNTWLERDSFKSTILERMKLARILG